MIDLNLRMSLSGGRRTPLNGITMWSLKAAKEKNWRCGDKIR